MRVVSKFIVIASLVAASAIQAQSTWTYSGGNTTTPDKVGVGTASPGGKLHVEDLANSVDLILSAGDEPGVPNDATFTLLRKNGSDSPIARFGLRLDAGETDKFKVLYGTTGGFTATLLTITPAGNVGVGTDTPTARLHVENLTDHAELIVSAGDEPYLAKSATITLMRKNGDDAPIAKYGLHLDADDGNKFKLLYRPDDDPFNSNAPLLTVESNGNLTVTGEITGAKVFNAVYQDVAEWVPATQNMVPGTVVVLNPGRSNEVMYSSGAYDSTVAGVVSAQPGLVLGVAGDTKEMIATTGRVKVKVDARRAPIAIGDLLVTSDVQGTAMKSEPMEIQGRRFHQPGTIIGKALEPLAGGLGEILVLLSMQ